MSTKHYTQPVDLNGHPVKYSTPKRYINLSNTPILVWGDKCVFVDYLFSNKDLSDDAFVQIYDAHSISEVIVGTTVPVWTIPVPSQGYATNPNPHPLSLDKGLVIAATLHEDGDITAPTTALKLAEVAIIKNMPSE